MVAGVPQCTLRIYQPTPTTVRFTVSTRGAPERFLGRITHYVLLVVRIAIAATLVLILWVKWLALHPKTRVVPQLLERFGPGYGLTWVADRVPAMYLLPAALLITWVIVQRGYRGRLFLSF